MALTFLLFFEICFQLDLGLFIMQMLFLTSIHAATFFTSPGHPVHLLNTRSQVWGGGGHVT